MSSEETRTVPFEVQVPGHSEVVVEADGVVQFSAPGGYHGEIATVGFSVQDLIEIAEFARRHHAAYSAWGYGGYEKPEIYFRMMEEME